MPMINRRAVLAGAAATASLPFLRGTGARAATPGILTFGISSYPPTIMPWANAGTASGTVKLMIYRGLTSYGPDGALRGELAESWSPDPKGWVFKLRDATFHNGEKVTAADVKWTVEQIAGEKSTAFFRTEMQGIETVETPDDKTVRFVMKQPTATLPQMLASLGAIFALAGLGKVIGALASGVIADNSRLGAVLAYGLGMALFTMVMGNAFAAFPVMAAAIGLPLLIQQYHGDPAVVAAVGMLCGFCGTLMTPMAANFNIVPAALLELKDRNAVVKMQVPTALPLLAFNIALLYWAAFR